MAAGVAQADGRDPRFRLTGSDGSGRRVEHCLARLAPRGGQPFEARRLEAQRDLLALDRRAFALVETDPGIIAGRGGQVDALNIFGEAEFREEDEQLVADAAAARRRGNEQFLQVERGGQPMAGGVTATLA